MHNLLGNVDQRKLIYEYNLRKLRKIVPLLIVNNKDVEYLAPLLTGNNSCLGIIQLLCDQVVIHSWIS